MNRRLSFLFCILVCFALAACGFQPLYGDHAGSGGTQSQFQNIYIGNIPDRQGQILRNDLLDRLYTNGEPASATYYLTITPIETHITDQAISVTSDATRAELRLTARMTLQDRRSNCILLRRDLLSVNSYNILSSEYTTLVSRQAVLEDELNDLAGQIENQLALYFARTPDPQATLADAAHVPAGRPVRVKGMPIVPAAPSSAAPICPALPGTAEINALSPAAQNMTEPEKPEVNP